MKKARVFVDDIFAGELIEVERGRSYQFSYTDAYQGSAVSLTMPLTKKIYDYDRFPPFFEGLLPEGMMLEALLKQSKLDRYDLLGQLIEVGNDLIGNVTVKGEK